MEIGEAAYYYYYLSIKYLRERERRGLPRPSTSHRTSHRKKSWEVQGAKRSSCNIVPRRTLTTHSPRPCPRPIFARTDLNWTAKPSGRWPAPRSSKQAPPGLNAAVRSLPSRGKPTQATEPPGRLAAEDAPEVTVAQIAPVLPECAYGERLTRPMNLPGKMAKSYPPLGRYGACLGVFGQGGFQSIGTAIRKHSYHHNKRRVQTRQYER